MDKLYSLYDAYIGANLWAIGISLTGAILAIRILVPLVIKAAARWRNFAGRRTINPGTWFAMQSRPLFKAQSMLLANSGLRELFAPASNFLKELTEEEKAKGVMSFGAAWLSPYPRAVKASIKANRGAAKGKKLDAHAQVREVARCITVVPLEPRYGGGDDSQHFQISIDLHGHGAEEVARIEGKISSQLDLVELNPIPGHRGGRGVAYAAHRTAPIDTLMQTKIEVDFLRANPPKNPFSLPMALEECEEPFSLPTHHTLVLGTTGSGKSSPLNCLIFQQAEFVEQGISEFYGIDPKRSELRPYEDSWLFKEVVYSMEDAVQLIGHVAGILDKRSKANPIDLSKGELGRSMTPSKTHPMVFLVIDEMLSLIGDLQTNRETATLNQLTKIMAMGRSLNILIVGATQNADKAVLGWMRPNIGNPVVLRQPSSYYNDLFLGPDAAKRGFNSTTIAPANIANGYRTAGIGFTLGADGEPVKVRFAHLTDRDISELIQRHPGTGSAHQAAPAPQFSAPAVGSALTKEASLQEAAEVPERRSPEESQAAALMAALRRTQGR